VQHKIPGQPFSENAKAMLNNAETQTPKRETVVVKKYANRRLYNTETSTYVTLDDLAKMVRGDRDFVVYDAKNGDDLTHAVLTQIIVEQESREGGQALLPIPFLRQLIRFYDDSIARMVPSYLQFSLEHLAKEQVRFREQFASAFANPAAAFDFYQQQARQNMAMFEQAMSMWASFGAAASGPRPAKGAEGQPAATPGTTTPAATERDELSELKSQLSAMQQKIEKLSQSRP
jgi:polyhydroxyalkanoate synthesis repressor PhaR